MKIAAMIARYLLGLMFTVFGLNDLFNFIPMGPMPTGPAGDFFRVLFTTHYVYFIGGVMVISGVLFLVNRFVPLALVLLGPVLANILVFHIVMAPKTIGMGIFVTLLWLLVAYLVRGAFAGILQARVEG